MFNEKENGTSSVDNFLQDISNENINNPVFEEEQHDVVESESGETLPTTEQPFHKDPKVQKFINRQVEKEIEKVKKDFEQKYSQTNNQPVQNINTEEKDDFISALTNIIGNDTPEKVHALKMFEKSFNSLQEQAAQKAYQRIEEAKRVERQVEEEAEGYLSSSFEEIEDTYGIDLTSKTPQAKKINNDFRDYLYKIAPKNNEGQIVAMPDVVSAFETFQVLSQKQNPQAQKAKELASKSMGRTATVDTTQPVERVTFDSISRMFNF